MRLFMHLSVLVGIIGFPQTGMAASDEEVVSKVNLFFPLAKDSVDWTFEGNREALIQLNDLLESCHTTSPNQLKRIELSGSASPLGGIGLNEELALHRTLAMKQALCELYPIPDSIFVLKNEGINWGLLENIVQNSELPYRDEILRIIREEESPLMRNHKLMNLRAGNPYREMMREIFPMMQQATTVTIYESQPKIPPAEIILETPFQEITEIEETPQLGEPIRIVPNREVPDEIPECIRSEKQTSLNISTNLLYWAALAPNIGIEYCFPQGHWSINGEFFMPWWKNTSNHKYYQMCQGSGEGRYWFNGDGEYRGHFVGAYGNGGIYDLSKGGDHTGYKGDFWGAGVTYGYIWRIKPRFRMEFSVGGGLLSTTYEEYIPIDNHYVYERTVQKRYVGPTKIKIGLVWTLVQRAKKEKQ